MGKPGTRFLLDNAKKSHAQNDDDDPLQPTAATAIDGHVAINRSNVATSPSFNPCALWLRLTLPLSRRCCSLTLPPEYCSADRRRRNPGRARETEVGGITRTHTHEPPRGRKAGQLQAGTTERWTELATIGPWSTAGSRVRVPPESGHFESMNECVG